MITYEQFQSAYQAFLVARGFNRTALRIYLPEKNGFDFFTYDAYPLTVNAAFACELFIKALQILQDGECKKGHPLDKLYDAFSDNTKASVQALYDKEKTTVSIGSCLRTYRTACVDWRYLFDKKYKDKTLTMAWTDLMTLNAALEKVAKEQLYNHPHNFVQQNEMEVPSNAD